MTKTNGNTLSYRVDQLEKNYCDMEKSLQLILTNHLPHISEQLARLETRVVMFTGINVAAMIITVLLHEII